MTSAENKLWLKLRAKQFEGIKFRRQHGIGSYIVDFYCPSKKIVIEVDGDIHAKDSQIEKDNERELFLKSLGLKVIRYTNNAVLNNVDGVLEDLYRKIG